MVDKKVITVSVRDLWRSDWTPCWGETTDNPEARETGISGTDWDLDRKPYKQSTRHQFIKAWGEYKAGKPFEQTRYIKNHLDRQYEISDLMRRFEVWKDMERDIQENGYSVKQCANPWDEYVTVAIGRDGDILFHNGNHRLAFCYLAGVKKIPVKVALRHAGWQEIRDKIEDFLTGHKRLYGTIDHPDLTEYPVRWDGQRINAILKVLGKDRQVLDLGANWGQLSFPAARAGHQVTAVDNDDTSIWFLNRLDRVFKTDVLVVRQDVEQYLKDNPRQDVIFIVGILHWLAGSRKGAERARQLYGRVKANEIYLQIPNPEELGPHKGDCPLTTGEYAKLISEATGLRNIDVLMSQTAMNGKGNRRRLYRLTK